MAVHRMIQFVKKLKHGVAFLHTSTAYAHTTRWALVWFLVSRVQC
jgi:hypothetical protein